MKNEKAAASLIKYRLTPDYRITWLIVGGGHHPGPSTNCIFPFYSKLLSLIQNVNFLFLLGKLQKVILISEVSRMWVGGRNGGGGVLVKGANRNVLHIWAESQHETEYGSTVTDRRGRDGKPRPRRTHVGEEMCFDAALGTGLISGIEMGLKEGWRWKGGPADQSPGTHMMTCYSYTTQHGHTPLFCGERWKHQ